MAPMPPPPLPLQSSSQHARRESGSVTHTGTGGRRQVYGEYRGNGGKHAERRVYHGDEIGGYPAENNIRRRHGDQLRHQPSRSASSSAKRTSPHKIRYKNSDDDDDDADVSGVYSDNYADDESYSCNNNAAASESEEQMRFIPETAVANIVRKEVRRHEKLTAAAAAAAAAAATAATAAASPSLAATATAKTRSHAPTFAQWSAAIAGMDDTESQSCSSGDHSRPQQNKAAAHNAGGDLESHHCQENYSESQELRNRFSHVLQRANCAARMAIAMFFAFIFLAAYTTTLSAHVDELRALHSPASPVHLQHGGAAFSVGGSGEKFALSDSWAGNKRAIDKADGSVVDKRHFDERNHHSAEVGGGDASNFTGDGWRLGTFSFLASEEVSKNYVRYPPTGYIRGLNLASLVHYELCCAAKNGDYICGTRHNYMYDIRMDSIVKSDAHGSFVVVMVESEQVVGNRCTLSFISLASEHAPQ